MVPSGLIDCRWLRGNTVTKKKVNDSWFGGTTEDTSQQASKATA